MAHDPSGGSMRSPMALAAGAAVLTLAGAGCGSSSSSTPSTSNPPKPSSSAAPASSPRTAGSGTTTTPGKVGEVSPSGDIPDNQAYVRYAVPGGGVSVKVPEGWSRVTSPSAVVFTDKLNSIRIETRPAKGPLTAGAGHAELRSLARSVPGFTPGSVTQVRRTAGNAVRVTYRSDAPPNPVTGKRVTDAVERYLFVHSGRALVLTLSGPTGADNVDPWRIVTNSVGFAR